MTDTWTHIVKAFTKDYNSIKEMIEIGPQPRCILGTKGRQTIVTVVEIWKEDKLDLVAKYNSADFDSYIDWTIEQLETWSDVRRMAYDQWYFKRKKDAEKFITLFNIKWAK